MWRFASPLVVVFLALSLLGRLERHPFLTIALLALGFAVYGYAALALEHTARPAAILAVAVVLRLVVLPLPISLSDDLLRYVWDGRVLSSGDNPYLLAPEAEELAGLRDARWEAMPHKHVPTVYPPLALLTFSIASHSPAPMLGLKILLALADLATCVLMVRLATALGLPPGRAIWYAWSPLAVVETAGMGHVDALGVALLVAAVLWVAEKRRPLAAGLAGAGAVLTKIFPAIALPALSRLGPRPWRFTAAALLALLAAGLPVLISVGGLPPGLMIYGVSWEWNGPIYEPLWRLYDLVGLDTAIKGGLDGLKELSGEHELWNRFYPWVYPQLLAKLSLAALFAGLWLMALRARHPVVAMGRIFGAFLLVSATLYPWYLLWVLPWAALCRHRAWLVLQGTVMISYLPQLLGAELFPVYFLLIWLPFWGLLVFERWSID